jgi:uncharacterized protein (TIGR02145 family)
MSDSNGYKFGTYFNWYTATMGSVPSTTTATYPIVPGEDICPAGWQLTRQNGLGSFIYLFREAYGYIEAGATTSTENLKPIVSAFPFTFAKSGCIGGDGLSNYTNDSSNHNIYFWLANTPSQEYGGNTAILGNLNFLGAQDRKSYGFSVRCVAK